MRPRYSLIKHHNEWRVRCLRRYSDETFTIPDDEAQWAKGKWWRMRDLFWWHRNHGLQRREPHPMGKDLTELENAYRAKFAEKYRKLGWEIPGCYLPISS